MYNSGIMYTVVAGTQSAGNISLNSDIIDSDDELDALIANLKENKRRRSHASPSVAEKFTSSLLELTGGRASSVRLPTSQVRLKRIGSKFMWEPALIFYFNNNFIH